MAVKPKPATGRNIVICCDGTGNEIGVTISNVLKLFRIAEKSDRQRVWYNAGVGTIGQQNPWTLGLQRARGFFGLATGLGLDDHVLAAYRFLCSNYQEGDRVYLFGFSRGAYTVRALARSSTSWGSFARTSSISPATPGQRSNGPAPGTATGARLQRPARQFHQARNFHRSRRPGTSAG